MTALRRTPCYHPVGYWPAEAFADREPIVHHSPARHALFEVRLALASYRARVTRELEWDRRELRAAISQARQVLRASGSPQLAGREFAYRLAGANAATRQVARMLMVTRAAKNDPIADLGVVDRTFVALALLTQPASASAPRRRALPTGWREPLPVEDARRVPLERLCARLGLALRRVGKSSLTTCPFHHPDEHPSLMIDVAKGLWFCFVCNIGGDGIRLVELLHRVDFATAVREVAHEA